jgi:hypothetical protein
MSHVQHTPAPRRNVLVPTRLRLLRGYRLKTAYIFYEYRAALGLSALRGDA